MYEYTKDQLEKKKWGTEFAEKVLNKTLSLKTPGEFRKLWKQCADFGLYGLIFPKQYGGMEFDLVDAVTIMEGIGYGCYKAGIMFSVNAHIWACILPLHKFGTEAQKSKYLPPLINGTYIGAHCITEDNSGSDIWSLQAEYEKREKGYCINGSKSFITNAPLADIFLVFARKKGSASIRGVSCFILEKDTENLAIGQPLEKMGLEDSPLSSVYLNGCFVPEENLLGREGQASNIFNYSMVYERPFLFAFQVGIMEKQLEECIKYAKTRVQFGKKIIEFQAVSGKIADMKVRYEMSKMACHNLAMGKRQHKTSLLASSIAKLYISESFVKNSMSAVEIFGACGYVREYKMEQHLRDALGGKIYSGTSDIQRNIIAALSCSEG